MAVVALFASTSGRFADDDAVKRQDASQARRPHLIRGAAVLG